MFLFLQEVCSHIKVSYITFWNGELTRATFGGYVFESSTQSVTPKVQKMQKVFPKYLYSSFTKQSCDFLCVLKYVQCLGIGEVWSSTDSSPCLCTDRHELTTLRLQGCWRDTYSKLTMLLVFVGQWLASLQQEAYFPGLDSLQDYIVEIA